MNEVNCPYCEVEIEIIHENGYGYEEDVTHQQECPKCGKRFVYTTETTLSHSVTMAPCLNGGEHELEDINGFPEELFIGIKRCYYCGVEFIVDEKAYRKARMDFYNGLKAV